MHELALAREAVRLVARDAARRGCRQVTKVKLRFGELTAVLPEAMSMAFTCASRGTLLEGAQLDITTVPARARCSCCGVEFQPEEWLLLCPRCHTPGARLLSGREMEVVSYEGK
ncbi:hydrogenase maturation nickel metallochaperone HypA [Moorella sulfitireducens (nom. illeg.)]|uniref:hydrogenase maturation nickel metallochaperone HypA n=1 Tax=Neomoorella sulfitireducens TaxID=2972948 RepID=UPI0021AD02CF|nr:hydrogenase maturation nickel metallochaperone HypA [Moorella sulfitireducens]